MRYWVLCLLLIPLVCALDCGNQISTETLTKNLTCQGSALTVQNELDCNGFSINGVGIGNGLTLLENAKVLNCVIENFENGIILNNNNEVVDSQVVNNLVGLRSSDKTNIYLSNLVISNNQLYGIYNEQSKLVTSNIVFNNNGLDEFLTDLLLTREQLLNRAVKLEFLAVESEELIDARITRLKNNMELLDIKREFKEEGELTKVILTITPLQNKTLKNVEVYEKIPKCYAKLVDNIVFNIDYKVIEDDPTVKFILGDLDSETKVSYHTKHKVDTGCIEFFQAAGVYEGVIKLERENIATKKGLTSVITTTPDSSFIIFVVILLTFGFAWFMKSSK